MIGLVARFDPVKGHETFVRAAALLAAVRPQVHFVMLGQGCEESNGSLAQILRYRGAATCHTLGEREDVAEVTAAFDIATCSSNSEAFPNTVGEAMACGVPCVVTDVGDCAEIVRGTGRVVPAGDAHAMAESWRELIDMDRVKRCLLGKKARRRIADEFSLDRAVTCYETLYQDLVDGHRSKTS